MVRTLLETPYILACLPEHQSMLGVARHFSAKTFLMHFTGCVLGTEDAHHEKPGTAHWWDTSGSQRATEAVLETTKGC